MCSSQVESSGITVKYSTKKFRSISRGWSKPQLPSATIRQKAKLYGEFSRAAILKLRPSVHWADALTAWFLFRASYGLCSISSPPAAEYCFLLHGCACWDGHGLVLPPEHCWPSRSSPPCLSSFFPASFTPFPILLVARIVIKDPFRHSEISIISI